MPDAPLAQIEIAYCTQCSWLLRASWMASELLSTFSEELDRVALLPRTGGTFAITATAGSAGAEPVLVWDRREDGGFPEISELKRRVRDVIAPDRSLGHHDRSA